MSVVSSAKALQLIALLVTFDCPVSSAEKACPLLASMRSSMLMVRLKMIGDSGSPCFVPLVRGILAVVRPFDMRTW